MLFSGYGMIQIFNLYNYFNFLPAQRYNCLTIVEYEMTGNI